MDTIYEILITLPGIFLAITLHEFAHGMVAYWNGDDTAKLHGRLTLNPLKHFDLAGFLMLLIFKFGWAKPVPINEYKFRNKKIGLLTVSLAGIVMNLLICITSMVILNILSKINLINDFGIKILLFTAKVNISFAAFNLLPIPPLDGSKVLYSLLPTDIRYKFYQYESYGMFILLILSFTNLIYYVLDPIQNVMYFIVNSVLSIII